MSVFSVPERTRISVDRFLKMAETGVLTEDDRVELIDGDIINMAPIGPPHNAAVARLTKLFVLLAGDSAIVLPCGSLRMGDYSMPEPDLMLLKPREDFYSKRLATPDDVLLAVEVSESSLTFDQGVKRALYARHGIAEYWVADIPGEQVHANREPGAGGYQDVRVFTLAEIALPQRLPMVQVVAGTLFA